SLSLPWQGDPETAVVFFVLHQGDGANDLPGVGFSTKGPVPFVAAFHGRKCYVTIERIRAIRRIRPGDGVGKKAHNFPLRKQLLYLLSIGECKRFQEEPRCFESGSHGSPSI